MKRLELNTDDESLREILRNGKYYLIPKFQRDYSWENEHWENLWEDISALKAGKETYHYMGYLVIQPPQNGAGKERSKVVDGQQRLTTFSLIILAAIKRLQELGNEQERIEELFKNFIGSKDLTYLRVENKLTLNRNNDYYYKQAVEGKPLPHSGKKRTVHLMRKALDYFHHKFKDYHAGQEIGKFIETISDNVLFTSIYIGSELNAYKVFETLNARGVQLSAGDLLKNYIFSVIDSDTRTPDEVLDDLDQQWDKIGENLVNYNHSQYILNEWNSRNPLVRKTAIFKTIKRSIITKETAKNYLDELELKSPVYAALLDHENPFWRDNADYIAIKKNLYFLKLFNIRQPISLLLAVYSTLKARFAQVLNWIKVFSFRYNIICGGHTGEQEALYNKIAVSLARNKIDLTGIKAVLLTLYPHDADFKQAFCDKAMLTEQSNKKVRYILARLEESMSAISVDEIPLTVEHILPLKPTSLWINSFGENWNLYNQRIGNLALVSRRENKALGQKPFQEKKSILLNTAPAINKNIADYDEWQSQSIESRQRILADQAVALWKII